MDNELSKVLEIADALDSHVEMGGGDLEDLAKASAKIRKLQSTVQYIYRWANEFDVDTTTDFQCGYEAARSFIKNFLKELYD